MGNLDKKKISELKKSLESLDIRFLCKCGNGHLFDYRERIKYPSDNKSYAPCQGKCPKCGNNQLSMVSQHYYPIKWNFLGD